MVAESENQKLTYSKIKSDLNAIRDIKTGTRKRKTGKWKNGFFAQSWETREELN